MPKNPAAWSAWNFLGNTDNKVCLTYWLNALQVSSFLFSQENKTMIKNSISIVKNVNLQNLGETGLPFLVTLNPAYTPENTLLKWSTGHPVPSVAASKASSELDNIQGKRRIWFCGAYQGNVVLIVLINS